MSTLTHVQYVNSHAKASSLMYSSGGMTALSWDSRHSSKKGRCGVCQYELG